MQLPWQAVEPIPPSCFAKLRHAAIFECCKWDPQVEDVCTLSPTPIVLTAQAWQELVALAENLASETIAAEAEVLRRPRLLKRLGLPWALRRRLAQGALPANPARHLRLIRFDFHFTTEGWRISEANSDVPGGFNEASGFARLAAQYYGGVTTAGDPIDAVCGAIGNYGKKAATVALVHATAFSDDRQVMTLLSRRLETAGHKPFLAAPDHLRWKDGLAQLATAWAEGPVDFCFRFFPAEWLPALTRNCAWWNLLGNCRTPLCNPASAIISQSKRLPLIWDELPLPLPTWRALLPRTFDVNEVTRSSRCDESLVLKPALGRVGDMIMMSGVTSEKESRAIRRSVRRHPHQWIAQERFEPVPLTTADGNVYPCVGIYTLDGVVVGAYGRVARTPLVNHLAQDAAILIADPIAHLILEKKPQNDSFRALQPLGA